MRLAFIPFLECILIGDWQEIRTGLGDVSDAGWKMYKARGGREVRIVTANNIRRYMIFNQGEQIEVGYSMLKYDPDAVVNEHEVDEDRWSKDNKHRFE